MTSTQFKKIWVRGTNWVGDCILSMPALEALRKAQPNAEITLAVRPWVSELFESFSAVDHLQIYDRGFLHRGWQGRAKFIAEIARQDFDVAILFPNSLEAAYLAWRAKIPERIGYATDGRGWMLTRRLKIPDEIISQHQTIYYLEIVRQAGIIKEIPEVRNISLPVSSERKHQAQERLKKMGVSFQRPLVGLNPGAFFGSAKRWLPERYASLADQLIEALGADVLIFGAASERAMASEMAHAMHHPPKIFSGETTLAELAALLSCCALIVTNDSGPMHVAAAVGTRTVAIFGPTDERATSPVGSHTRVVKRPVSCSPCLLRQCPLDHRCMTGVSVDDVFDAAMNLLSY